MNEYLSGEASASPAVEPLLEGARRLAAKGLGTGLLSARNGLRTTAHANVPFEMLSPNDFLEVADYDPHLDRLLLIGKREPHPFAGLHALIYRAKREVGAIAMIDLAGRDAASVPEAKKGHTTLENAMGVLEALRGRDSARWRQFLVVTGRTPDEAVARAEAILA